LDFEISDGVFTQLGKVYEVMSSDRFLSRYAVRKMLMFTKLDIGLVMIPGISGVVLLQDLTARDPVGGVDGDDPWL